MFTKALATLKSKAVAALIEDEHPIVSPVLTLTSTGWLIDNLEVGIQLEPNCTNKEIIEQFNLRIKAGQKVTMYISSELMQELVATGNQVTGHIPEKRPSSVSEKEIPIMEKQVINLHSGYDNLAVASFELVGPTLAIAILDPRKNEVGLINHILHGLTLKGKEGVTDEDVFVAFKKKYGIPGQIHVSPQGYIRITGEDLSDGCYEKDLAICTEPDYVLNEAKDGFRCTVYPDGPSTDEVDVMEEDEDVDWGTPVNRFYAFSWIEMIEPCPRIAANDAYQDENEEKEVVEVEA